MLLKVNRLTLLDALKSVSSVILERPTHPVLGNFLITPSRGKLIIRGTNLSTTIERTIDADINKGRSFCLPKKLTLELLGQLSFQEISIEIESGDTVALVSCGSAEVRIQTLDAPDFAPLPELPEKMESVSLPVKKISEIIARVASAASPDETKRILQGIHLKGDGESLEFAATDGHRLAVASIESVLEVKGLTFMPDFLQKVVSEALKAKVENLDILVSKTDIMAKFEGFRIFGRMLDGDYPKYRQLIPVNFLTTIEVNRKAFLDAVELVAIVASQDSKNARIIIDWECNKMTVSAIVVDSGTAKQVIDCSGPEEAGKIQFSSKYLLQGIKFYSSSETVKLNITGQNSPATLSVNTEDSTYLLMPIQILREN